MLQGRSSLCGSCGNLVFLEGGYRIRHTTDTSTQCGTVFICPSCRAAIYFAPEEESQAPGGSPGTEIQPVPLAILSLYAEARDCITNENFTASVLVCRKLLLHVAVEQGAEHGLRFSEYVGYLFAQGCVPPNARDWVEQIRQNGDEANHEIAIMTGADAKELIAFVELLLKNVYQFPGIVLK